jgi:hypothetical protein
MHAFRLPLSSTRNQTALELSVIHFRHKASLQSSDVEKKQTARKMSGLPSQGVEEGVILLLFTVFEAYTENNLAVDLSNIPEVRKHLKSRGPRQLAPSGTTRLMAARQQAVQASAGGAESQARITVAGRQGYADVAESIVIERVQGRFRDIINKDLASSLEAGVTACHAACADAYTRCKVRAIPIILTDASMTEGTLKCIVDHKYPAGIADDLLILRLNFRHQAMDGSTVTMDRFPGLSFNYFRFVGATAPVLLWIEENLRTHAGLSSRTPILGVLSLDLEAPPVPTKRYSDVGVRRLRMDIYGLAGAAVIHAQRCAALKHQADASPPSGTVCTASVPTDALGVVGYRFPTQSFTLRHARPLALAAGRLLFPTLQPGRAHLSSLQVDEALGPFGHHYFPWSHCAVREALARGANVMDLASVFCDGRQDCPLFGEVCLRREALSQGRMDLTSVAFRIGTYGCDEWHLNRMLLRRLEPASCENTILVQCTAGLFRQERETRTEVFRCRFQALSLSFEEIQSASRASIAGSKTPTLFPLIPTTTWDMRALARAMCFALERPRHGFFPSPLPARMEPVESSPYGNSAEVSSDADKRLASLGKRSRENADDSILSLSDSDPDGGELRSSFAPTFIARKDSRR